MRFAVLLLVLAPLLGLAPAAQAAVPAAAHSTAVSMPQDEGVQAASSGGRSRGGYHSTTSGGSDGDGGYSPWELWLAVTVLCGVVVWWVVVARRKKSRENGSD